MRSNPAVLKERLKTLIDGNKVVAALFYTFEFNPKFFENYIMPLLVPDSQFLNNSIANNIIWRKLYKDDKVPPISVYYDHYAKSHDAAPMLNYNLVGVNMPSVGKNKGNFHPKNSFILVQKHGNKEQYLIVITGSNNITQRGWCENLECISEIVLDINSFMPYGLKKQLQNFISNTRLNGKSSEAEQLILIYLNKRIIKGSDNVTFYDSFEGAFGDYLEEYILSQDEVTEVEIISPFFKNDAALVEFFKEKNIKVKIEAPFRDDHCMLEKTVFDKYLEAGVKWFRPSYISKAKDPRNVHSKVYRLYGGKHTYTIIGSVNFTAPAWQGYHKPLKKVYNIESAIIYRSKEQERLFSQPLHIDKVKFIAPPLDPEVFQERIEAPQIEFLVDWHSSRLSWKGKTAGTRLVLMEDLQLELDQSSSVDLKALQHAKSIIESLARNPLLHVRDRDGHDHYYYPNQEGFEYKPLEYRFSASDILEAWQLLGEEITEADEWMLSRLEVLTELAQDESGMIIKSSNEGKSLLNEMAQHLHGLVQLEKHLFERDAIKKDEKKRLLADIKYYLTYDNVDTLVSYLGDISKLHNEKKMLGGYYWLILNVIHADIYNNPFLKKPLRTLSDDDSELKQIKTAIVNRAQNLEHTIAELEKVLNVSKSKLAWAKETLELDYENIG